ncbi:DNA polymerase I [bacterium]|mgnify:CR=1 FL=1|jgi:DNA polymerase I|nr:DNA polymerase I [bacterium]
MINSTDTLTKKFMIVDGHSLAYRAFYAFPESLTLPNGDPINAVYGFIAMLFKSIEEFTPHLLCICFDRREPTHRHKMYEPYKAHRPPAPDNFKAQMPVLRRILEELNIKSLDLAGYEGDDLLGTLSTIAESKQIESYVMTGDTDALQLVTPLIKVVMNGKGKNPFLVYTPDDVFKKYQLNPNQLIDFKALKGDSSDNIPGVKGIGDKTATALLSEHKTLINVYNNIESIKSTSVKTKLETNKEIAFLSYELVKIVKDIPIDSNLDQYTFNPDWTSIASIFETYNFHSLFKKYSKKIPKSSDKEKQVNQANNSLASLQSENIGESSLSFSKNEESAPSKLTKEPRLTKYGLIESEKELTKLIKTLGKTFSFDLETTSKNAIDAQIVGISFSNASNEAFYLALNKFINSDELNQVKCGTLFQNFESETKNIFVLNPLLKLLKPIFEDPSISKITHNGKYEISVLKNYNINLKNICFDTMLAAFLLYPSEKIGLKALASTHLNVEMTNYEDITKKDKTTLRFDQVPITEATEYACADADLTWQLFKKFEPLLKEENLETIFNTIEMPVQSVLADMECNGVSMDPNFLINYQKSLTLKGKKLTEKIHILAEEPFNIKSPKQLSYILFEKLKLPVIKKTKTGFSTDASVLEKLKGKHEIADYLLSFRTIEKLLNTYVSVLPKLLNDRTKKIHTSFNQAIAQTGRLSSTNPNLQNIPIRTEEGLEIRKCFIPSHKDWSIVSSDYSQIELRIIAHLANDENLVSAFNNNQDIHVSTASIVFHTPVEEITKEQRYKAKAVNFGILYGISAFGLSENLKISRSEAKEIIDSYYSKFPKIQTFIDDSIKEAQETGYVVTEFGRKRPITDILSSSASARKFAERIAVNTKVQGTAADIIKIAMINMQKVLVEKQLKTKLIIQVHDELVFDAPDSELNILIPLIKSTMEQAVSLKVPLNVDLGHGKNWKEVS